MTIPALPARNLGTSELTEVVNQLADRPDAWRGHVEFGGGLRHYACLHRDEYLDIWLICWSAGNDTGWHDHDVSSGAVRVVTGTIAESNPRIGGVHARRIIRAGASFAFGPEHIHRLEGTADTSISVHAYSPPLWRLGQYTVDGDGVLRRVSVCYADELRPLAAGGAALV
jgi:predicted metal-dependent enzyme (double-stranded beta helix superfamily)